MNTSKPTTVQEPIASIRDAYAGRLFPRHQIPTFRNIERAFPSRTISKGGTMRALPKREMGFQNFKFDADGNHYDLYDYVSRNRIAGLLVLHGGERIFENYEFGNAPDTRWMSMSMAKSISTTLIGVAIQKGFIRSLDDQLMNYVPELAGGAYADVTVRQLMLMASGVQWNEDHTNPDSERRQVLELQIAQRPGAILQYMSQLPRLAPPGSRWNYSTGETHLVGVLLKAATGRWLADFLSEHLWSRLGMESDASWWLESPEGLEIAGSGIAATLRDYGRFGQFICEGGEIDGQEILPPHFLRQAAGPTEINRESVPYGYMWWSVPNREGRYTGGAFSARGIFGQRLYINPAQRTVVVLWSARSKPMGDEPINDNAFCNAASDWLAVRA